MNLTASAHNRRKYSQQGYQIKASSGTSRRLNNESVSRKSDQTEEALGR